MQKELIPQLLSYGGNDFGPFGIYAFTIPKTLIERAKIYVSEKPMPHNIDSFVVRFDQFGKISTIASLTQVKRQIPLEIKSLIEREFFRFHCRGETQVNGHVTTMSNTFRDYYVLVDYMRKAVPQVEDALS